MKDQYVIKLSDNRTVVKTVEEIVNDINREIRSRNAYKLNVKSYTLPTTIGVLLDKCTVITFISRMVSKKEVKNTFRTVFERLYGEDYDSKVGICRVIRAVTSFIAPDLGSDWLKAEVYPGGFGYKKLLGSGDTSHIVGVNAIKQIIMEIEIEGVVYRGISRTLIVANKVGELPTLRFGYCVEDKESIENVQRFLDNEIRRNKWEENERYDKIMVHHGVVSNEEEDEHYNLALAAHNPKDLPFVTMAYLETMTDFLFQVVQGTNYNLPSKASNISLN